MKQLGCFYKRVEMDVYYQEGMSWDTDGPLVPYILRRMVSHSRFTGVVWNGLSGDESIAVIKDAIYDDLQRKR